VPPGRWRPSTAARLKLTPMLVTEFLRDRRQQVALARARREEALTCDLHQRRAAQESLVRKAEASMTRGCQGERWRLEAAQMKESCEYGYCHQWIQRLAAPVALGDTE
jgi:hypothetical protein